MELAITTYVLLFILLTSPIIFVPLAAYLIGKACEADCKKLNS